MRQAFELLHPAIQRVLWDMNWKELRSLQVKAIESFFASDNSMILSASTASGKTEAAFLPLLSAIADQEQESVSILYVGPLKALINDQFSRIADICMHSDIPVHRWHGDVSATDKQRLRSNPGGVLLITPESLESAFINYGSQVLRIFKNLQYIVIDELHAFVADVRGIHLRSLIARLSATIGRSPRLIGLSATLADFDSAKRFLNYENSTQVEIIKDEGNQRSIRVGIRAFPRPIPPSDDQSKSSVRSAVTAAEASLILESLTADHPLPNYSQTSDDADEDTALRNLAADLATTFAERTNLIFTNSRSVGEMLADEINQISIKQKWPRNPFVLHHGSLSKDTRSDVEDRLKKGIPLSVFCTSTLEMGIDIGSVYSVGQLGPPWSVASLVQRLGRSGRREGEPSILRLYSLDSPPSSNFDFEEILCPQLLRCVAMVELMLEHWLEPFESDKYHFSTLIHQILSMLRQGGGCKAPQLFDQLVSRGAFRAVTVQQFASVLKHLGSLLLIEQMVSGVLILTPQGEAITHGRDFYAAFAGSSEYVIRHYDEDIGKMPSDTLPPIGEHLILNGRRWQLVDIDGSKLVAEVIPAQGRKKPIFLGSRGDIHCKIVEKMSWVISTNSMPAYLQADAANLLSAVRKFAHKHKILERPWIEKSPTCSVFPWTGTRGMQTLSLCAKIDGIETEVKDLIISYRCNSDDLLNHLKKVADRRFDPFLLAQLLLIRARDKYDEYVPMELLDLSNSERAISINDASDAAMGILSRFYKLQEK